MLGEGGVSQVFDTDLFHISFDRRCQVSFGFGAKGNGPIGLLTEVVVNTKLTRYLNSRILKIDPGVQHFPNFGLDRRRRN